MLDAERNSNTAAETSDIKKSVLWIYYVLFFAVLNESVFNVSTPSIADQFGLDESGVSWVVTIFFILIGLGMPVFGKLSDIFSVKTLIIIGIVLYSFGSVLGFVLQNWFPGVIIARAFQGAGCAAIPALVFVMVARFFSAEERGKMFGIITSTVSFAVGIGPVLGGYFASFHWSYLFLVPLPILAAIPFFQKYLPKEQRRDGRLDIVGTALLGIVVSMLVMFTTEENWFYLPVALLALVLFIVHIRRAREPFVDPALFVNSLYRSGIIIGFLIFGTVMSIMFVLPLMLSKMYGLNTEQIGLIMFPGAFSAVIFGKIAGNLTVKRGSHFVIYLGLALLAVSLLLQSSSIGLWVWYIGIALIMMYIGFSFMQTALAESVTQILPGHQIGVGMGFFNMISTISGAVVTALVAKAMEQELFAFRFHPVLTDARAFMYGNLILILCLIVLATGLLYFITFGKRAPQPANESA
ncbi:MFS transporter [Effusibacillus lacus]|uniref:Tetracycline resistance MFS efflux pump n=1 Tax=Effusibacillus lacus TaxID=1348429 RepID=A0A292YMW5_9BACL|nr:MFS transporter [Effusibacillus lacus]TCS69489.1 DHA2 family metal-tetracycline-proton antiporter-like MFS transporter [Effusibacillus lacus]GAX90093.1 tetracycline resistance MFS efflux pump [Effusibacillus lacus]